ncbi:MAG: glycosyltransferase family 4 protein [Acidobacteriia bacterium]|nr:glycosyltransferase family 4 protein [Terriglobia bacterium]
MRILIAAPVSRQREGGVANVVHNTAEGLRARGHQVTCLFREDLLPRPVAFPRFEALYFAVRLARELRRRRAEFDVVNIHAPTGFVYGLLRRLRRAGGLPPYVMLLHGLEERRNHAMAREAQKGRAWYFRWKNRVWQRLYHMPLYRWSITTADHAVVINRETWSMLQLKYRREIGRVWYIPNGIEPRFFLPRDYPEGRALRLLFAGTWIDHKGVYYLCEGFETLAQRHPDVRLTIAGCAANAETVKQAFAAGARDRVEVLPFVSAAEMPALYARHDIFVFPSLMEGLPIVLLEAMATGMPVVTTETCGMMDMVEDEYNGLLVKPADSAAFAAAIERMMDSPELRRQLGRAAQETMRRHTWERTAAQLEKVFALATAEEERK